MKIRMFKQVIEVGGWEANPVSEWWVTHQEIEDAEQVKFFIEESKKEDTRFYYQTYKSPRYPHEFRIRYKFVEEIEKGA